MSQIEVQIKIGGRSFDVACQQGEEQYLLTAARMLDNEADVLVSQIGRMPEGRMLLMAGLMLADKTAGLEDRLRAAEDRIGELTDELGDVRSKAAARGEPAAPPEPERIEIEVPVEVPVEVRVEVPVLPEGLAEALAEMAARAEALADTVEEKAAS